MFQTQQQGWFQGDGCFFFSQSDNFGHFCNTLRGYCIDILAESCNRIIQVYLTCLQTCDMCIRSDQPLRPDGRTDILMNSKTRVFNRIYYRV